MLQKNASPSSELCHLSSQRPKSRGKGKSTGRCFPSCSPRPGRLPPSLGGGLVILGGFACLFVCFPYKRVADLLTQRYASYCKVLFGPGPPVLDTVHTGTVPDRQKNSLPELITDVGRVPRVESNSPHPPDPPCLVCLLIFRHTQSFP